MRRAVSNGATLWLMVLALGIYHGLNPAMGWPLALARGLEQGRAAALFGTLMPLTGGHFAAMAVMLVPFAWISWYAQWATPVRVVAGALVLLFGLSKLLWPRHPRALARVRPAQLAWWSFLMATAHGAGLMLLPFMLGLCAAPAVTPDAAALAWAERGHAALMAQLARSNLATAMAVAALHTLAMLAAGATVAWLVYRWLGLRALRSAWLNLDTAWGVSLVLAGAAGVWMALGTR